MDVVWKLFDQITASLPPQLLQMIRLGALLVWLIAATIVGFYSWQRGAMEAPQSGQDLSMATIREKITREENLKRPDDITIPELQELTPENELAELPYDRLRRREGRGLAGEDDRLREPETGPGGRVEEGNAPPFLGDTQSSSNAGAFPRNIYKPGRDPGAAGIREESGNRRPPPGAEIPVFSVDPAAEPVAPVQPLRPGGETPPARGTEPGTPVAPRGQSAAVEASTPSPVAPAQAPRVTAPASGGTPSGAAGSSAGGGLDLLPVD